MSNRITPEIRALVGRKHGPYRVRVEQGAIEKFADAIGDDNPAYRGPDAVAPPTFPTSFRPGDAYPDLPPDFGDVGLHASQVYELERPIRAGDELDVSFTIVDITEKSGRTGDLVFVEREVRVHRRARRLARRRRQVGVAPAVQELKERR